MINILAALISIKEYCEILNIYLVTHPKNIKNNCLIAAEIQSKVKKRWSTVEAMSGNLEADVWKTQ